MKNQVQLIAYTDRLSGGGFRELQALLEGPLAGLFGGVHLLPFFWSIDGADAGFDPIDHTKADPRLGSWDDVRALASSTDLMADLIVNHISTRSPQFTDFRKRGDASSYACLFLTYGRVFPDGAPETELLKIYRPRPGLPFTKVHLDDGTERLLWTTFTSEQVDIDVRSSPGKRYLDQILGQFQAAGIRAIRLDAAGYAIKKRGTSCFMIPETFEFIGELTQLARQRGIEVLVEIHSHYLQQIEIAKQAQWVYDFALPPLVLHALYTGDVRRLKEWLEMSPRNAITVLDTHDGIGVIDAGPDRTTPGGLPGLLTEEEIASLVETIHLRSAGDSRRATGAAATNLDLYQINCTYYDALGRRDDDYLIARAIQFFAPGVPQVYYVGLLAGTNDMDLLRRTGAGREINRHYYTRAEVEERMEAPVVRSLFDLIRFRNAHPAFAGDFEVHSSGSTSIAMEWRKHSDWARLDVDLAVRRAAISHSDPAGERKILVASTVVEANR
ncbi:MAG TPA: sucrose phosphorylase [Bryobacteraceae bacterium]|nr:sucrose phosphorylase [Bryobacteraceae bacterium]